MSDIRNTIWIDEWCGNRFENREDAIKSAKRNALNNQRDVAIWRQDPVAVVRFPEPDLVVEEIVSTSTT